LKRTAKAFAPAAISSFFEICDTQGGKPITDLEKIGAIGGGFGLQRGVLTKVTTQRAEKTSIDVLINSKQTQKAKTTIRVIEMLLAKTNTKYNVTVEHKIEVPIGSGLGPALEEH